MVDDVVEPPTGGKSEDLPTGWMGTDDASNQMIAQREAARRRAVEGITEFSVPPPLKPAELNAEVLTGAGDLRADARVVAAVGDTRRRFDLGQQLSDRPAEIRDAARTLAQAVKDQIAELREARRNDTDTGKFTEFLEMIARELDKLVDALDHAIQEGAKGSADQGMFLGEAKKIADQLKTGFYEWLEQHRANIAGYSIKIGLVGAAAMFLHTCGIDEPSLGLPAS